ncbi:MAG TPA: ABC transporter permease [Phycisphaeraceae bacterium]
MSIAPGSWRIGGLSGVEETPATVITPKDGVSVGWRQLWRYRGLAWTLLWRDVQVRYKQTLLGAAWAVIQPLALMVAASVVFGWLLGLDARVEGSYALFAYAGLVPWTLFAAGTTAASNSLLANAHMLQKVYFPRLVLPVSAIGAPLVDFAASGAVLLGWLIWQGSITWQAAVVLPLAGASIALAALGVGTLLAAMTATYRDLRLAVPLLLQVWFFLTPVVYPLPVSPRWEWVLSMNPVYGPIQACRAAMLSQPVPMAMWAVSLLAALACWQVAAGCFARVHKRLADVI